MKQIPIKVDNVGDTFNAAEINSTTFEEQNIVTDTGQSLSGADLHQVSKAAAVYAGAGDYYSDTGTASAYQLASIGSKKYPPTYVEGQKVRFTPANSNSGTPPVTARIATLPAKNIKKNGGTSNLEANDIVANFETTLSYRTTSGGFWELVKVIEEATTTRRGIIQIATPQEIGVIPLSTEKAVVPDYLAYHPAVSKKWVVWSQLNSSPWTVIIHNSFGLDSPTAYTNNGQGDITFHFSSNPMKDNYYRVHLSCDSYASGIVLNLRGVPTTTSVRVNGWSHIGSPHSCVDYGMMEIFGQLQGY